MRMTRQEKISAGKIWHVYLDADKEKILHEGSKTACMAFISKTFGMRKWREGYVRIAQIIWEADDED